MLPTPAQMRAFEETVLTSDAAADLAMDEAGLRLARLIRDRHPQPGTLLLFPGPGHNAGDALVAARHLAADGWKITKAETKESRVPSPRTASRADALSPAPEEFDPADPALPFRDWPRPWIALDALLGIGARLPLPPDFIETVHRINHLRAHHGVITWAVDIPTGLDGASGIPSLPTVIADVTATFAVAKSGLLADTAAQLVGRLAVLRLATLPWNDPEPREVVADAALLARHLPPRPHDLHKGSAGRVAILAGSQRYGGAAILTATGALRGGAGLVTVFTPQDAMALVASRLPPEAILLPLESFHPENAAAFDSIAIGPGLGDTHIPWLASLIRHAETPILLDADALNQTATGNHGNVLAAGPFPAPRLLTPHPGELARIFPRESESEPRADWARRFLARHPHCTLLLKGPRTIVVADQHPLGYNPTGSAALASGGSGDLLTGLAAALLARMPQSPWHAALAAAWLHGRAAELAQSHGHQSPESTLPTTLAHWIGPAFTSLRNADP